MPYVGESRPSSVLITILRRCLLGFLVGGMLGIAAPSAASDNWVQILRDDDSGTELLLHAGVPVITSGRIEVPGFVPTGDDGQPQTWSRALYLASKIVKTADDNELCRINTLARELGPGKLTTLELCKIVVRNDPSLLTNISSILFRH